MESYGSVTQESFLFAIWNNLEVVLLSRQAKAQDCESVMQPICCFTNRFIKHLWRSSLTHGRALSLWEGTVGWRARDRDFLKVSCTFEFETR